MSTLSAEATRTMRFRTLVRDALCVAAIALFTCQMLRRWGGDYYAVPTGSMAPTLHGDETNGDIVLVDKRASARDSGRHDMVVVANPEKPKEQLVKRIAACGDDENACCIDIRDGDVWLGPDRQHMSREQKDPIATRALRVPWATVSNPAEAHLFELRAAFKDGAVLVLPPAVHGFDDLRSVLTAEARQVRGSDPGGSAMPNGFVGTARPVDASFSGPSGRRAREGDDAPVLDCGMDLRLERAVDDLLVSIDRHAETLTFHWAPRLGTVTLWRNGIDVATASLPPANEAQRIEFGRLDDRVYFIVDGRTDASLIVSRRNEWQDRPNGTMPPVGPRTYLHVGVVGKNPLRLQSIAVFRDLFAWRERIAGMPGQPGDWPIVVPPGHWFLLGDNSFDSHDSRHFGAVPMSSFLGRPQFVLGPWPRQRWLGK